MQRLHRQPQLTCLYPLYLCFPSCAGCLTPTQMPSSTHRLASTRPPASFAPGGPGRIVGWYLVASFLWIIGSDHVLAALVPEGPTRELGQTVKGIFFVSAVGVLLWWLIRRSLRIAYAAHAALDRQQEDYQRLFATIEDPILVYGFDADGAPGPFIAVNAAAERVSGYTHDALLKLRLSDLLGGTAGEQRLHRADGSAIRVEVARHEHGHQELRRGTALIRDVSERLATQQRVIEAERLAAAGIIASGLAHEFNNLHAIIAGQAEVLAANVTDPVLRERIGVITSTTRRAAGITHGLLALSRRGPQRRHAVPLADIIRETVSILRGQLEADGVSLVVASESAPPALVDHHQIGQVIMNLLINGWHALSGRSHRQLTIRSGSDGERAWFTVSDSGHGLEPAACAQLFQPFFTTKPTRGERPGITGTGLGLSLCQAIIESHNGSIAVTSAVGSGTTFTVHLPVAEQDIPMLRPTPAGGSRAIGSSRVLVLEDEVLIRDLLRDHLGGQGYAVRATDDGAEALRWLSEEPVDVILLDHRMPKMSGPEFLRRMLAAGQEVPPVIAISGWPDHEDPVVMPAAVVAKPFTLQAISAHIQQVITG